jgi:hypothetical protein
MPDRKLNPQRWLATLVCACALAGAARTAHAGVTVGLSPATGVVPPGGEFDVTLDIKTAGSSFNGFSVVLSYDPAVLTLLPMVPTNMQEGCLMTGVCSKACGNTFHQFAAAGDSILVNDYLFCNAIALTGPGHLYQLHFRASSSAQLTSISIRRATFYNAGVLVTPVQTSGASLQIPTNVGVGDGAPVTHTLRVEPNPAHGRMQLVIDDGATGAVQADILDLQGRLVRSLGSATLGPRARLDWDGADRDGKPAPGGLYLARIQRGGKVQTSRFILLR